MSELTIKKPDWLKEQQAREALKAVGIEYPTHAQVWAAVRAAESREAQP